LPWTFMEQVMQGDTEQPHCDRVASLTFTEQAMEGDTEQPHSDKVKKRAQSPATPGRKKRAQVTAVGMRQHRRRNSDEYSVRSALEPPTSPRSLCKSPGQQGSSKAVRQRRRSMQLPLQQDLGERLTVLPLTLTEQVMEEDTDQPHGDRVSSGLIVEGYAQDVPKSPTAHVTRKRSKSLCIPQEMERFSGNPRTKLWGAATTSHGAPPLSSGWWCDDTAYVGRDVFVSLQATPDTTDLGYTSVMLPQLWKRADDIVSPALPEDSADVINIGRGPAGWMDVHNHGVTLKSCQSEQQQQQQATFAARRSKTALSHRSARKDLCMRPSHLVDSLSCGPGSGAKDLQLLTTPARRPLPTSEVTLGSEDTHSTRQPRSSSARGRCCTNKGGSDARFFRPSMQKSIRNDSPACKRKEPAPV
jgi:hypothetical protein